MADIKRIILSALGGAGFGLFVIWALSHVVDEELMGFIMIVALVLAAIVATGISETIIANEEGEE